MISCGKCGRNLSNQQWGEECPDCAIEIIFRDGFKVAHKDMETVRRIARAMGLDMPSIVTCAICKYEVGHDGENYYCLNPDCMNSKFKHQE